MCGADDSRYPSGSAHVLRRLALVGVALAIIAGVVGHAPGRRVRRDVASCDLKLLVRLPTELSNGFKRYFAFRARTAEPAPMCEPDVRELDRPALSTDMQVALLAIAVAGLLVVALPRARSASAWLAISASAAFLAFVTTRGFDIRADETTFLWPYYAARVAMVVLAGCLVGVLGWLIRQDAQ